MNTEHVLHAAPLNFEDESSLRTVFEAALSGIASVYKNTDGTYTVPNVQENWLKFYTRFKVQENHLNAVQIEYTDIPTLYKNYSASNIDSIFQSLPFEATLLWTENFIYHSFIKVSSHEVCLFNKTRRIWFPHQYDDSGYAFDLNALRPYVEAHRLVELTGSLADAEEVVKNCPHKDAFIEIEYIVDGHIHYYLPSRPEDLVNDWAYLWDGQNWEPSDDGYITNKQLMNKKDQFKPISALVDAIKLVKACK